MIHTTEMVNFNYCTSLRWIIRQLLKIMFKDRKNAYDLMLGVKKRRNMNILKRH